MESARAIITRWRSPIDSCSARSLEALARPEALQQRGYLAAGLARPEVAEQLQRRVVARARARDQVERLAHEAELVAR